MIEINEQHLSKSDQALLRYLQALGIYRAEYARQVDSGLSDEDGSLAALRNAAAAMEPDWRETAISAGEAARRYQIPPSTLTWFAREGALRAEKRGKLWYFSQRDLDDFVFAYQNNTTYMAKVRTRLAVRLGWAGDGLIEHDEFDTVCPTCGAFAVEYHPDWQQQDSGQAPWVCARGHRG